MTTNNDGFVIPQNPAYREFNDLYDKSSLTEIKTAFSKLKITSPLESHWNNYFSGLVKIKEDQDISALNELQKVYDSVKHRFTDIEREQYRLAGLALKKIGWIYRKNKDFEKAYFYHSVRYQYMTQYGSSLELHDSAISLDIDSYYLKDLKLSEFWLLLSRQAAVNIQNPIDKRRCLGITDNNLASTYSLQKKFTDAVDCIFKSLDSWIDYEALTGPHENKVVWAYYGVADIYESWALHKKETHQNYSDEQSQSQKFFQKALDLATQRKTIETDISSIRERLNKAADMVQS